MTLSPFNRNDTYEVKLYLFSAIERVAKDSLSIDTREPIKFVDKEEVDKRREAISDRVIPLLGATIVVGIIIMSFLTYQRDIEHYDRLNGILKGIDSISSTVDSTNMVLDTIDRKIKRK